LSDRNSAGDQAACPQCERQEWGPAGEVLRAERQLLTRSVANRNAVLPHREVPKMTMGAAGRANRSDVPQPGAWPQAVQSPAKLSCCCRSRHAMAAPFPSTMADDLI